MSQIWPVGIFCQALAKLQGNLLCTDVSTGGCPGGFLPQLVGLAALMLSTSARVVSIGRDALPELVSANGVASAMFTPMTFRFTLILQTCVAFSCRTAAHQAHTVDRRAVGRAQEPGRGDAAAQSRFAAAAATKAAAAHGAPLTRSSLLLRLARWAFARPSPSTAARCTPRYA